MKTALYVACAQLAVAIVILTATGATTTVIPEASSTPEDGAVVWSPAVRALSPFHQAVYAVNLPDFVASSPVFASRVFPATLRKVLFLAGIIPLWLLVIQQLGERRLKAPAIIGWLCANSILIILLVVFMRGGFATHYIVLQIAAVLWVVSLVALSIRLIVRGLKSPSSPS
jgi:hypothetical protein